MYNIFRVIVLTSSFIIGSKIGNYTNKNKINIPDKINHKQFNHIPYGNRYI